MGALPEPFAPSRLDYIRYDGEKILAYLMGVDSSIPSSESIDFTSQICEDMQNGNQIPEGVSVYKDVPTCLNELEEKMGLRTLARNIVALAIAETDACKEEKPKAPFMDRANKQIDVATRNHAFKLWQDYKSIWLVANNDVRKQISNLVYQRAHQIEDGEIDICHNQNP